MVERYDVVTLGETMIRLSPPRWQRLEQAESLEVVIGGSESNVAVCLSRLGLKVAWVSRLPQNPLGRRIVQAIRAHGVDVDHVRWAEDSRAGIYFVEYGYGQRTTKVYYDRKHSAMSEMTIDDFDAGLLDRARCLHLTGITAALSPECDYLMKEIFRLAAERGVIRSFDVNYRAKLWSPSEAREALEPLCAGVDVLFVSQEDAVRVFECKASDPEQALGWLQSRFEPTVAVLTLGEEGAVALDREGLFARAEPIPTPAVDPLGSGDAFCAGFLYAYLTNLSLEVALQYGVVAASLKRTIPGDLALLTLEEIQHGVASLGGGVVR